MKTILDNIIDLVAAAIETVTVANGYNVTVTEVYRPKSLQGTNRPTPSSYSVQLTMGTPAEVPDLGLMGNPPIVGWNQPLQIDCMFRPSDTATTAIEQELNVFWGDITQAIMADPQWNDYAIDSQLTSPDYEIDDAGRCYVTGIMNIIYRLKENDPFTRWNAATTPTIPITMTPTGAYELQATDHGHRVRIDDALTIPTGLPTGFACIVETSATGAKALTTTGLTVTGGDAAANISPAGTISIAITTTDTALLAGDMET